MSRDEPVDEEALTFTVATVWRDERVSCPHPDILKTWLGSALPDDASEFVEFHLRESACPYCNSVVEELQAQDVDAQRERLDEMRGRLLRSTVTFLRAARG